MILEGMSKTGLALDASLDIVRKQHCRYHLEHQCRKTHFRRDCFCDRDCRVDRGYDNGAGTLPSSVSHFAYVTPRLSFVLCLDTYVFEVGVLIGLSSLAKHLALLSLRFWFGFDTILKGNVRSLSYVTASPSWLHCRHRDRTLSCSKIGT